MKVTLGSISKTIIDGDWIESKDQAESGIRLIQTGNVGEGEYLDKIERAKYISESTFHELNCTEIFGGDILISRLPEPVGRACILPSNLGRTITAVDCTIVRLDKEICDTKYLLYFTQSDKYYNQLKQYLAGTTRTRISRKNLEKIEIDIPSLDTQREVVCHFDSLLVCINKHKKLMETYDEMIKSRFIELFGDLEENTNGLTIETLDNLCKVSSSKRIMQNEWSESGVPFLRISDINNRIDKGEETNELYIPVETYHSLLDNGLVPESGDILITSRGTLGKCYIVKESDRFYFQDGMISWLSNIDKRITSTYLSMLFSMPFIQKQIEKMQAGSTVAYLSISMLRKMKIVVPSIEAQNEFIDFVEQTNKAKKAVQESLDNLEILKKALMQKYFG